MFWVTSGFDGEVGGEILDQNETFNEPYELICYTSYFCTEKLFFSDITLLRWEDTHVFGHFRFGK